MIVQDYHSFHLQLMYIYRVAQNKWDKKILRFREKGSQNWKLFFQKILVHILAKNRTNDFSYQLSLSGTTASIWHGAEVPFARILRIWIFAPKMVDFHKPPTSYIMYERNDNVLARKFKCRIKFHLIFKQFGFWQYLSSTCLEQLEHAWPHHLSLCTWCWVQKCIL